jgi:precorrin-2 dehydrogenase/sirohydrochlorin ferrochelatase
MERLYPLSLRLAGRRVLIVGGGVLAQQKLHGLEPTGAAVRLVARETAPGLGAGWPPERLEVHRRSFRSDDLDGCTLAFGATDDAAVNRRVVEAARARGILANAVDDPAWCDFHTPAVVERHGVLFALSTSGGFPGLTRALREVLEAWLPEEHGDVLQGLYALRRALLTSPMPPAERGRVLRELARRIAADYLTPAAAEALSAAHGPTTETPRTNLQPERP